MSVILDALHKARADRRQGAEKPHEQTVARVVDAATIDAATPGAVSRPSRQREWLLAFGVIIGLVILFALAAGSFILIYQQLRQIGGTVNSAVFSNDSSNQPALPPPPVVTEALPTPVPLSDLPVQSPALAAAPMAVQGAGNAAGVTPDDFKLGTIACENGDCIATLNGRSARVGDVFRGYEIIAIDEISVRLKAVNGADEVTISLFD